MLSLSKLFLAIKIKSTFLYLDSIFIHSKLYLGLKLIINLIVFSISSLDQVSLMSF